MGDNCAHWRRMLAFLAISIYEMYASQIVYNMAKVTDLYARLIPIETPVFTACKVGCASRCYRGNVKCSSFNYNSQTKQCTIGSLLINSLSPREPDTELFYEDSICKQYNNFKLYSRGNVSSCLWISCAKSNYADARQMCQGYNSTLYALKVIEKIYILADAFKAVYPASGTTDTWAWVGLNELDKIGTYRWENDGTELNMSSPYKTVLFHAGQPSNINTELCISFSTKTYYPLHDISCSSLLMFACERRALSSCV